MLDLVVKWFVLLYEDKLSRIRGLNNSELRPVLYVAFQLRRMQFKQ